jgi:hypothetical protein
MTWRLLVLFLSAAPQAALTPWTSAKGVDARELRFTDKAGEHVVRFGLSAERREKGPDDSIIRSRELVVIHTIGKKEVWRAKDFVEKCEFDLTLDVVEGSIKVTDLDDDGEAEISFLYRLSCRSDVSPLTAKLLLYEGAAKYALRGETKERVGEKEFAGGTFTPDPAFEKAPRPFLEFAKAQWNALVVLPSAP